MHPSTLIGADPSLHGHDGSPPGRPLEHHCLSPSQSQDGLPTGRPPDEFPFPTTPPGSHSPLQSETVPTRTQPFDSLSPDLGDARRESDQPVNPFADPFIVRIDEASTPNTR